MIWTLVRDFWAQFHKVWGHAREGRYDKRAWMELQERISIVLRAVGLERRGTSRTPDDIT